MFCHRHVHAAWPVGVGQHVPVLVFDRCRPRRRATACAEGAGHHNQFLLVLPCSPLDQEEACVSVEARSTSLQNPLLSSAAMFLFSHCGQVDEERHSPLEEIVSFLGRVGRGRPRAMARPKLSTAASIASPISLRGGVGCTIRHGLLHCMLLRRYRW